MQGDVSVWASATEKSDGKDWSGSHLIGHTDLTKPFVSGCKGPDPRKRTLRPNIKIRQRWNGRARELRFASPEWTNKRGKLGNFKRDIS